jgi:predicted dehydrogenase/threonine dehydrogenase-like Zn-dependent dehydrogenase
MKQLLQNWKNGRIALEEIPAPGVLPGEVLIANESSDVSAGTEKMAIDIGKKSLLGKALDRPDQVRRVLEKIRQEGWKSTWTQVQRKLQEPNKIGYSSSGIVLACGAGVEQFKPGQRVASNGPHAEIVSVPKHLVAAVDGKVSADHAAFGILGSIALQGLRLARCEVGSSVLVIGLGLIGQLTVGLARAAGLRVCGVDPAAWKNELAIRMGAIHAAAQWEPAELEHWGRGLGFDAVLIAASTSAPGPMDLAIQAVRPKGRVVLIGVVPLELDRRPWYFKEAEFVVSCSYGPGRYDPNYEERGRDYPAAHVRWTEQRNLQAVVDLIASSDLDVEPLITHRIAIERAMEAYSLLDDPASRHLGMVLQYAKPQIVTQPLDQTIYLNATKSTRPSDRVRLAVLGAGNYANAVLIPMLQSQPGIAIEAVSSARGVTAWNAARESHASFATTDSDQLLQSPDVDALVAVTRHDLHADQVCKALELGKPILVEKPLCLTMEELRRIDELVERHGVTGDPRRLQVGFNRRYAPMIQQVRRAMAGRSHPWTISFRMNVGTIPASHWVQEIGEGGGRLIGEACHAIDLAVYLTGALPVRVYAESIADPGSSVTDDQAFLLLRLSDGSVCSIGYLAGGDRSIGKESLEVIGGGMVISMEDYRTLKVTSKGKTKRLSAVPDKGHRAEIAAWSAALRGESVELIPWEQLRAVTAASILAVESLRDGLPHLLGKESSDADPEP